MRASTVATIASIPPDVCDHNAHQTQKAGVRDVIVCIVLKVFAPLIWQVYLRIIRLRSPLPILKPASCTNVTTLFQPLSCYMCHCFCRLKTSYSFLRNICERTTITVFGVQSDIMVRKQSEIHKYKQNSNILWFRTDCLVV